FDYGKRKMYLKPNSRLGDIDQFDRSGFWLLGDGNALKVADVASGSAGEQAGLRAGDRIIAIDHEPIAKRTLAQWRQLLSDSSAGASLDLRFERDGKQHAAQLILADRIPPRVK